MVSNEGYEMKGLMGARVWGPALVLDDNSGSNRRRWHLFHQEEIFGESPTEPTMERCKTGTNNDSAHGDGVDCWLQMMDDNEGCHGPRMRII